MANTSIDFKINGVTNRKFKPYNWEEFTIELNFDKDKDVVRQEVTTTNFEFVNEGADEINNHLQSGLNNGNGVFEGLPLEIEVSRNGVIENPFNGYIDLVNGAIFSENRCKVNAAERNRIDWLNDIADSFTMKTLYDKGFLTSANNLNMPYILNSVPNYLEVAVATLGTFTVIEKINQAIETIAEFTAELIAAFDVSVVIRLVLYILYLALLIIALVNLVKNIIKLIIQPVKYHACMSIKTQLEASASYLNMTFHSPILDSTPFIDSYIIPEKYYNQVNTSDSRILGFTNPSITQDGFYKGTFGELLRECKKIWNAKIVIKNQTEIWLVRDDEITNNAQFTLPPLIKYENPFYGLNTNEFKSNRVIAFQTDSVDKNTIQEYQGTIFQVTTEPIRVGNNPLMKGLEEVNINFALAKRKETLTVPEEILKDLLKTFDKLVGILVQNVNKVIGLLNKVIGWINFIIKKLKAIGINIPFNVPTIPTFNVPSFAAVIDNRKGMLIIESDIINKAKICIINKGSANKFNKLDVNNSVYFSGLYLYENYHFINSFLPTNDKPNGNQYYLYDYGNIPFTFNDFEKVKENNCIFTADGQTAIIDYLKWNVWNQKAQIKVRVNKLYTNNLKEIYYNPDGR